MAIRSGHPLWTAAYPGWARNRRYLARASARQEYAASSCADDGGGNRRSIRRSTVTATAKSEFHTNAYFDRVVVIRARARAEPAHGDRRSLACSSPVVCLPWSFLLIPPRLRKSRRSRRAPVQTKYKLPHRWLIRRGTFPPKSCTRYAPIRNFRYRVLSTGDTGCEPQSLHRRDHRSGCRWCRNSGNGRGVMPVPADESPNKAVQQQSALDEVVRIAEFRIRRRRCCTLQSPVSIVQSELRVRSGDDIGHGRTGFPLAICTSRREKSSAFLALRSCPQQHLQ